MNLLSKRIYLFYFSIVAIVVSIILLVVPGLPLGIDFTSGSTITYSWDDKNPTQDQISESMEKAGGNKVRQLYKLIEGIEQPIAKQITADVKSSKIKVQVKINGNELRVDGKKKDDLQAVMQMIQDSNIGIPVQFINFRD